uniref:Uncharacterized protein n=1 Tax=Anopheles farauti TaxID=69004 RepID=A0A182QG49_9DIPT
MASVVPFGVRWLLAVAVMAAAAAALGLLPLRVLLLVAIVPTPSIATACGLSNPTGIGTPAAAGVLLTTLQLLLLLLRPGFWSPPADAAPFGAEGEFLPEPGEILPASASSEFSMIVPVRYVPTGVEASRASGGDITMLPARHDGAGGKERGGEVEENNAFQGNRALLGMRRSDNLTVRQLRLRSLLLVLQHIQIYIATQHSTPTVQPPLRTLIKSIIINIYLLSPTSTPPSPVRHPVGHIPLDFVRYSTFESHWLNGTDH